MKQPNCQKLVHHVNRLTGQMEALKVLIEKGEDCGAITQLALSIEGSFRSLKAGIVESFVQTELMEHGLSPSTEHETLDKILKLVRG